MDKAAEFAKIVTTKIDDLVKKQGSQMDKIAQVIYSSLKGGGVWNLFGSGHSHMVVEEAFHRAGGLIPVNAWLEEYLMPHAGPSRNGPLERLPGLAKVIFDFYKPQKGEVLTIISNSGINATSVEMAEIAKASGIQTLGITNIEHAQSTKSRSPSGKKLFEVCDWVIDTGGVVGDASISIKGLDVKVGPLSTLLSSVVINCIAVSICEQYSKNGEQAPVYLSANLPGGDERNKKLEASYRPRIPRLQ